MTMKGRKKQVIRDTQSRYFSLHPARAVTVKRGLPVARSGTRWHRDCQWQPEPNTNGLGT